MQASVHNNKYLAYHPYVFTVIHSSLSDHVGVLNQTSRILNDALLTTPFETGRNVLTKSFSIIKRLLSYIV